MERTQNRPLVTGAMTPRAALDLRHRPRGRRLRPGSGRPSTCSSAVLAVAACLFYVFVYTLWLKRTSTSNIVIGGAAGAVPVLIGWAAVTGTPRLGARRAVRDHLLLDAAPLLGPGHPLPRRLRRPPTCRCCRRSRACGPPRVRILGYTLLLWALTLALLAGRRHGRPLPRPPRSCSAASSPWLADPACCAAPDSRAGHAPVHLVDHLHHPAVRRHGRSTSWSGPADDRAWFRGPLGPMCTSPEPPSSVTEVRLTVTGPPLDRPPRPGRRARRPTTARPAGSRRPSSAPATTRSSAGSTSAPRCSACSSAWSPACWSPSSRSTPARPTTSSTPTPSTRSLTFRCIAGWCSSFLLPLARPRHAVVPLQVGAADHRLPPGRGRRVLGLARRRRPAHRLLRHRRRPVRRRRRRRRPLGRRASR